MIEVQRHPETGDVIWVAAQPVKAVIAELVRLKELKSEPRTRDEDTAYVIAKEDAWQAARALLSALQEKL